MSTSLPLSSDQVVIRVSQVTKRFRYWIDQPSSIKTLLVRLLQCDLSFGERKEFTALDDVSFDIRKGEFVGIMGRNGAGKSTLLKLICGIYSPTCGTISVKEPIAPLIELGAGFHPDLSGYENIFLNASVLGFGKKATLSALNHILEFAELGDHIHMPTKKYSSGMMVRLGFSIAAHLNAPIILIDEVLAVGDAGFQAKCIQKIQDLHKAGRTIILITHSPEAVRNYCQRCIVISNCRKLFDGPASAGVDAYLESVQLA